MIYPSVITGNLQILWVRTETQSITILQLFILTDIKNHRLIKELS